MFPITLLRRAKPSGRSLHSTDTFDQQERESDAQETGEKSIWDLKSLARISEPLVCFMCWVFIQNHNSSEQTDHVFYLWVSIWGKSLWGQLHPLYEGAESLGGAGGPPPSMVHAQAWQMVDELSRKQYGFSLVICWILDTQKKKKPYNLNVFMCTCIHVWERVWEGMHVPPRGPSSGPHTGKECFPTIAPVPAAISKGSFPLLAHTLSSGSTIETTGCLSQFTHLPLTNPHVHSK